MSISLAGLQADIAVGEMNRWTEAKVDDTTKKFKDGDKGTVDFIHEVCSWYPKSEEYSKGTTNTTSYKFCCELVDYCSFYKQTWFYIACGGGALLILIIVGVIISCCCCCKGRRGGGKDLENSESSEESTKDEQEAD